MKIVYATVEDLFAELKTKGVKEARAETVAITRTIRKTRWVHFYLYVTAKVDGVLAQVVIPYHRTTEGMVQQQGSFLNAKESSLLKSCMEIAKKNGINLLSGAYWEEGKEPFMGALKEDCEQEGLYHQITTEEFEIPF